MFVILSTISQYINPKLENIKCQENTKAYIASIFKRYSSAEYDFSQESIVLLYAAAKEKQDFYSFQNIGDWLFFSASIFPESMSNASEDLYNTIARSSYYRCYKLINKQWKTFEELSDTYCYLVDQTRSVFSDKEKLK